MTVTILNDLRVERRAANDLANAPESVVVRLPHRGIAS